MVSSHVENTKSKVGFLANYVMKNYQFERSVHQFFLLLLLEKNCQKVLESQLFGKKSVHSRLLNKNTFFLNFFRPFGKR